jgi:hypothetical protein
MLNGAEFDCVRLGTGGLDVAAKMDERGGRERFDEIMIEIMIFRAFTTSATL